MATNRPWFRFGLRFLFLILTLACLTIGWGGSALDRIQRQQAIIARIRAADASVYFAHEGKGEPPGPRWLCRLLGDEAFSSVESIYWFEDGLVKDTCNDQDLAAWRMLSSLESIAVGSDKISDKGLQNLAQLPKLEFLELDSPKITAQGIDALSQSPNLKFLQLRVHSDALAPLPKLQHLKLLELSGARSEHLSHVVRMQQLPALGLIGAGIEEKDLRLLQQMPNLKSLRLEWVPVSSEGLTHLSKLPNLEALGIRCQDFKSISLSDSDLQVLQKFPELRDLSLEHCSISAVGIAHLRHAKNLRFLKIECESVTEDCVTELSQLTNLEELDLRSCRRLFFREQSLKHLERLTKLRLLQVEFLQEEDARNLQAALPGCEIQFLDQGTYRTLPRNN
jgi:hypothetical protein